MKYKENKKFLLTKLKLILIISDMTNLNTDKYRYDFKNKKNVFM